MMLPVEVKAKLPLKERSGFRVCSLKGHTAEGTADNAVFSLV